MDCELPVGGHRVHHLTPGSFLHTKKKGTSTPNPWSNHMQMACTNRKCILPFFGKEENTKTFSVVAHMELHCLVKPGYRLQTHRYTNLLMKLPASDTSSLNFSDSAVGMLFDMSCNNNNKNRKITLEPKQVKTNVKVATKLHLATKNDVQRQTNTLLKSCFLFNWLPRVTWQHRQYTNLKYVPSRWWSWNCKSAKSVNKLDVLRTFGDSL